MEKVTQLSENGEGGIRTHDALADMLVFKTRAINHSTTSPTESVRWTEHSPQSKSVLIPPFSSQVWPAAAGTCLSHIRQVLLPSALPGRNAAMPRRNRC